MVDLLGRTGQRIELIPLDAWRREIMAAIVAGRARPLAGFLSLLSDWSPAPLPVLDTSRARALLSPPGEPPLDTLVPRWLSAAMGTDWPPAAAR